MKNLTSILGGTLAFQLLLALALSFSGPDHGAFKAQEPLLAFDAANVDQIAIDQDDKNSVVLTKRDGAWVLPAMADFPASDAKVKELLGKLADLKKGWPVATSAEAAKRFKVTDAAHERRIVLKTGGKAVGELLLGTSQAFKQSHARSKGDGNIYNVTLASYDAGAHAEDWMNRDYLNLPEDKIASVSTGDIAVDRKDKKFVLSGLKDGEKQIQIAVTKLVGAVSSPPFDSVLGKGDQALAKVNEPDLQVTVKRDDGSTLTYKFKKEATGDAYLFSRSDRDFLFKVAEASVEPIVKANRDKLVVKAKTDGADAQAATKPQSQPNGGGG